MKNRCYKNLSLLTDLYELTMMQGYFFNNPSKKSVFDMFFRRQPFNGGFTILAGVEPLVNAIMDLQFTDNEIKYLKSLKIFKPEFLNYLSKFKFKGDIYTIDEGNIVFPNEPLLRVHGNIIETQLLESIILNFINFQSLIATKTARIVISTNNGKVLEFGLRRAQGIDGALSGTRASYIGGAVATSNTMAGMIYNIPVSGTMAHSWIMSFKTELEAFEKYIELYPDKVTLLVDTFDTLKSGIPNAIRVFKKIPKEKRKNLGIRLDSGDLEYLSKQARKMLDENGLQEVKIIVSNELDEWIINQLIKNNSPIDAWGVGTKLITADKDPSLTGVYKVVAKEKEKKFEPCIKISNNPEKITNPGIKNIYRFYNGDNLMIGDLIYLEDEEDELKRLIKAKKSLRFNHPSIEYVNFNLENYSRAEKLLHPIVKNGKRIKKERQLNEIRNFTEKKLNELDTTYKRLLNPHIYKVSLSDNLMKLKFKLIKGKE